MNKRDNCIKSGHAGFMKNLKVVPRRIHRSLRPEDFKAMNGKRLAKPVELLGFWRRTIAADKPNDVLTREVSTPIKATASCIRRD